MPDDPAPPPQPSSAKWRVFLSRFGSTVVLWSIIAAAFLIQKKPLFFGVVALVGLIGLIEYFRLFTTPGFRRFRYQAVALALVYYLVLFWGSHCGCLGPWIKELDGLTIAVLVILLVLTRLRSPLEGVQTIEEIASAVFGFVYVVMLFAFVGKIMLLPLMDNAGQPSGHWYMLYLLAVTKFTDMGAYLVGSLIGRDKMIPHISPGKTWQGFAGAIGFAFLASFGCRWLFGDSIPLVTPGHAAGLALALSLVAVLGDLAESILKRSLASKDSGHLMPGIGGVLDLIDSLLFTGPILYCFLLFKLGTA